LFPALRERLNNCPNLYLFNYDAYFDLWFSSNCRVNNSISEEVRGNASHWNIQWIADRWISCAAPHKHASRYARICEWLFKKSRHENEIGSTTAANYRNLRVFPAVRAAAPWPGVSLHARRLPWVVPCLFAAIGCDDSERSHVGYTEKSANVRMCEHGLQMRPPVRRTGRAYIRRFPRGKFITRLIEYRRMRSEKYYAWLESPACTRQCICSPAHSRSSVRTLFYMYIWIYMRYTRCPRATRHRSTVSHKGILRDVISWPRKILCSEISRFISACTLPPTLFRWLRSISIVFRNF